MTPFRNPTVAAKFDTYPKDARKDLLALRELVFEVAKVTHGVGAIEETLKWGEPAYLTVNGNGSTVRMDWKAKSPERYGLYFNCNTDLVQTFRTLFPSDFRFEGSRALIFTVGSRLPRDALRVCLAASLTYHAKKKAVQKRHR